MKGRGRGQGREAICDNFPPKPIYSALLLNSCIVIHTAKPTENIAVPTDATSAMIDIFYSPLQVSVS